MSMPIPIAADFDEHYAAATAALMRSQFAQASIPARTAWMIGYLNGLEGRDQRAELETSEDLAAFDAGMAAGTATRDPAAA